MASTPSCTLEERIQVNYLILYDRLKGKMQIYKQMPPINIDHLFNHAFIHSRIEPSGHQYAQEGFSEADNLIQLI